MAALGGGRDDLRIAPAGRQALVSAWVRADAAIAASVVINACPVQPRGVVLRPRGRGIRVRRTDRVRAARSVEPAGARTPPVAPRRAGEGRP